MREMKDSGIEWIGEIPADWKVIKNKYLLSLLYSGGTPSVSNNDFYCVEGGTPFVSISDMSTVDYVLSTQKRLTDSGLKDKNLKILPIGTILYSIYATVGAVSELKIEAAISQAMLALQVNSKVDKSFYKYNLAAMKDYIFSNANGNTQFNLNTEKVKNFYFVLPNVATQRRIANYLDHKCSQIDAIIARQQEVIEKLKAYKLSVITEAVTKGLNPDVPMKDSGVEWIGEIPQCWSGKRLADLCDRGITYGIVKLGDEDESGIKVLRCSDVNPGYIDESNIRTVTSILSKEYNRTILRGGEVVVNVRGTLGGCAIVPEHMRGYNIAREVAMVSVTKANPQFVMYNILSKAFQSYQQYSLRGVIYTGLNIGLLSKYMLFLPSIDEQEYIVNFLNKKITCIDRVIQKKQCLLDYLQEYKKALIYEVVTGKKEV